MNKRTTITPPKKTRASKYNIHLIISLPKNTDLNKAIIINIPAIFTGWVIAVKLIEVKNIPVVKIIVIILSKVRSFGLINNEKLQQSFRQRT